MGELHIKALQNTLNKWFKTEFLVTRPSPTHLRVRWGSDNPHVEDVYRAVKAVIDIEKDTIKRIETVQYAPLPKHKNKPKRFLQWVYNAVFPLVLLFELMLKGWDIMVERCGFNTPITIGGYVILVICVCLLDRWLKEDK